MLCFAIISALLLRYAHAQGPMFKIDPKWSPPPTSNTTILFGDIALTPEQEQAYLNGAIGYNAVIGQHLRWKDAIIPYKIDCSIENLPDAVAAIHAAIKQWERKTCIRFVEWTNEKFHLTFFRSTHCWGNVGQVSYSHISVGPGCEFEHVMAHEIGHVVGLYHEQNRKDRDDWVKVLWENIGQFRDAFRIVKNTDPLGIQYDYESIMHYPWNAFTSNGKNTMKPIRPLKGKIPYIEISKDDIRLVSRMYDCPAIEKKRHGGRRRIRKRIENKFDRHQCVDFDRNCPMWADKLCTMDNVKKLCKRSCADQSCFGSDCIDMHDACPAWKKMGHCDFIPSVQMDCQKSCNPQCKAIDEKLDSGRTEIRKRIENKFDRRQCIDRDRNCVIWAKKLCKTEKVKKQCKRSCADQSCFGGDCIDLHKACPIWKKMGHCDFVDSVQMDCQRSCNPQCKGKPTAKPPSRGPTEIPHTHKTSAPTTMPSHGNQTWPNRNYLGTGHRCIDKNAGCARWAKRGECERNRWWMLRNCRKSCPKARCDKQVVLPPGKCNQPLGLSVGLDGKYKLADSAMNGTSGLSPGGGWHADARNARLYFEDDYDKLRIGAWCAGNYDPQHIDVDLQEVKTIAYIATQGRDKYFERVSEYKIQYSIDGVTYTTYQDKGKDRVFYGNCDHVTPVLNQFKSTIRARYMRYIPVSWNWPCVRMEFYGC